MAFIFSTSHLPETRVRRLDHLEDEEDDVMQPMPRAGGVRAFSHLPQPLPRQADSEGPLSTRRATPVGRPRPTAAPEADTDHAPEPDTDPNDAPEADSGPHAPEDTSPWHSPRISAKDQRQSTVEVPPESSLNRPTRSSGFDGTPHADRSAATTRSSGFAPSQQDLRDAFHSPIPDSPTREAPAQDSRPAQPRGHIFEKRSEPEAFLRQQMGKGASGTSSQQRLQVSQQALEAQQQQARGANPPAQGGRPAAQQPVPPQAQTQAPAQGGAAMQQNQGTDATKQGGGATPAKDGRDPLTILSEKFAAFPNAVKALKQLYTLPTGKLMIDKLATVADKIKIGLSMRAEGYMDGNVFRVRRDIDEFTLAHEFQHLGELLFGDKNPFLKVEDPEDVKKYPNLTHYDKEFRAMRIQNQIRLERARMNKTTPFLHPTYYDKTGAYPIPGSRLPQP